MKFSFNAEDGTVEFNGEVVNAQKLLTELNIGFIRMRNYNENRVVDSETLFDDMD